jgi:hypothetical protein
MASLGRVLGWLRRIQMLHGFRKGPYWTRGQRGGDLIIRLRLYWGVSSNYLVEASKKSPKAGMQS